MIDMIKNNSHAFTLVEEEPFLKFVNYLNQNFIPIKADAVKNRLRNDFLAKRWFLSEAFQDETIGKMSKTTDLWTSDNNKSIMAITSTWYTYDFIQKEIVLAFCELHGDHSGKNIGHHFHKILKDFNLEKKVKTKYYNLLLIVSNFAYYFFPDNVYHNRQCY